MLFEGKLTSILVCQKCKHISQTYEDFNDLSLSIKAEDYARERKRDRLKNLAKKFKNLHGTSLSVGLELQRSSSVPASPSANVDGPFMDESPIVEPRRRSLDYVEVAKEESSGGGDVDTVGPTETSATIPAEDGNGRIEPTVAMDRKIGHVEFSEPLKADKKDKKVKDDDGWARLGRRISMKVTKKPKDKEDRHTQSRDIGRGRRIDTVEEKDSGDYSPSVSSPGSSTTISTPQQQLGSNGDASSVSLAHQSPLETNRSKIENPRSVSLSPALPSAPTISPPLPTSNRFPLISRASSPSRPGSRAKSPQPLKATAEEAAYLQQILADITPSSSNPFGIFKPPIYQGGSGNMSSTATNILLKIGQLSGIEECLRMFTAVEVLDGENMVGCRRCWKIANGKYKPKARPQEDSDSDESEKSDGTVAKPDVNSYQPERVAFELERASPPPSSASASASSSIASLDTQSDSIYNTPSSSPSDDAILLSQSHSTSKTLPVPLTANGTTFTPGVPESHLTTYGGMTIPVISTTAPEPPFSPPTTAKATFLFPDKSTFVYHSGLAEVLAAPLPVKDLLRAPKVTRHKRMPGDADNVTESADESSDDALDSDASGSMLSDSLSIGSRAASPVASPSMSVEQLLLPATTQSMPGPPAAPTPPKVSRSKQVIMRPAFKRYLIATPPPVLVIHLKRFQQVSKTPMMSFSSGFKKLEDFVAFPQYLDIGPFIAPRKEDFGLGKGRRLKTSSKRMGRCMYRLYAVVVHIGNMVCFILPFGLTLCFNDRPDLQLGGHYVAYTALPSTSPTSTSQSSDPTTLQISASSLNQSQSGNSEQNVPRKWAYISDTVVRLATLEEVLKAKAYICMYERI